MNQDKHDPKKVKKEDKVAYEKPQITKYSRRRRITTVGGVTKFTSSGPE